MKSLRFLSSFGLTLILAIFAGNSVEANDRPLVSVSGVAVMTDDAAWREGLVGFGLRGLVAQELYNSRCVDVTEDSPGFLQFTSRYANHKSNADIVISGKVQTFNTAGQGRKKSMVAPPRPMPAGTSGISGPIFDTGVAVTTIRIELSATRGEQVLATVSGQGDAKWKKIIVLKDQGLPFEPSLVAPALRSAVKDAVVQLTEKLDSVKQPRTIQVLEGSNSPIPIAMAPLTLDPAVGEAYPVLRKRRVAMGLQSVLELAVREDKSCTLLESDEQALQVAAEQWEVGQGLLGSALSTGETVGTGTQHIALDNSGITTTSNQLLVAPVAKQKPRWLIYAEVFSFSRSINEKNTSIKGQNVMSVGIQLRAIDTKSQIPICRIGSATSDVAGDWKGWNWSNDGADINWKQDLIGQAVQTATSKAWLALKAELTQGNQVR